MGKAPSVRKQQHRNACLLSLEHGEAARSSVSLALHHLAPSPASFSLVLLALNEWCLRELGRREFLLRLCLVFEDS